MKPSYACVLSLALAACSHAPPSSPPATPSVRAPSPCAGEPLHVSWSRAQGATTGGGSLELVARVEYLAALSMPLRVDLHLPPGVQLVQGAPAASLPPAPQGTVREVVFRLDVPATPAEDLRLELDAQGQASGVHSILAYRFGRPAPTGPRPVADGPRLVVGDIDHGPSIDMSAGQR